MIIYKKPLRLKDADLPVPGAGAIVWSEFPFSDVCAPPGVHRKELIWNPDLFPGNPGKDAAVQNGWRSPRLSIRHPRQSGYIQQAQGAIRSKEAEKRYPDYFWKFLSGRRNCRWQACRIREALSDGQEFVSLFFQIPRRYLEKIGGFLSLQREHPCSWRAPRDIKLSPGPLRRQPCLLATDASGQFSTD